jgi:hypothetical protein
MTEGLELLANMGRAGTGFHADQTARNVGEAPLELAPRYNRSMPIETDQMECVLADINADRGDGG